MRRELPNKALAADGPLRGPPLKRKTVGLTREEEQMVDLAAMNAAVTAVRSATELLKAMRSATNSLETAETRLQVAAVIERLADAQLELATIKLQTVERESEIVELRSQLDVSSSMTYEAPYYWQEVGGIKSGPFCQLCFDQERLAVRLQQHETGEWRCGACKECVRDTSIKSEPPILPSTGGEQYHHGF